MSFFWDPRARKPQFWVVPFFIFLTILVALGIWMYGNLKADAKDVAPAQGKESFK